MLSLSTSTSAESEGRFPDFGGRTMFELLKSLVVVTCLVPVVMAIILGLIYAFGELCNFISSFGHSE
ncbi:hypothetical protein SOASR031_00480 [Leminorella grimontii]|nr:hypothetical protein SOASR031_00480 [Leminorella grimontii]